MAARWTYSRGLHDLGAGLWAWLQPDGGWGWSNAGLIVDADQSLLVDTLFDMPLTAQMLSGDGRCDRHRGRGHRHRRQHHANGITPTATRSAPGAEIIARPPAPRDGSVQPAMLARFVAGAPAHGAAGQYVIDIFGKFDFAGVGRETPTRTFSGDLQLEVGDKSVELIEVGPAHTAGDVLVHVPQDRAISPATSSSSTARRSCGPGRWATGSPPCERILAMDVDIIVPAMGPITDKAGVRGVRTTWPIATAERASATTRASASATPPTTSPLAISPAGAISERIAVNVDTLYRGYRGDTSRPDTVALFALMSELRR